MACVKGLANGIRGTEKAKGHGCGNQNLTGFIERSSRAAYHSRLKYLQVIPKSGKLKF